MQGIYEYILQTLSKHHYLIHYYKNNRVLSVMLDAGISGNLSLTTDPTIPQSIFYKYVINISDTPYKQSGNQHVLHIDPKTPQSGIIEQVSTFINLINQDRKNIISRYNNHDQAKDILTPYQYKVLTNYKNIPNQKGIRKQMLAYHNDTATQVDTVLLNFYEI